MPASNLHIITGGPGSGKTAIVDALRGRGYTCVDEVGRQITREQVLIGGDAVHWGDRAKYLELMLSRAMADHERVRDEAGPVFFDRGIPELIGYCALSGLAVPRHLREAVRLFPYARVVFAAPPWRAIYRNDAERKQGFAEAVATYEAVTAASAEAGHEIVRLPLASVEERVAFILERIGERPA